MLAMFLDLTRGIECCGASLVILDDESCNFFLATFFRFEKVNGGFVFNFLKIAASIC